MNFSEIKNRAKGLFKESYWPAVGVCLIPIIPTALEALGGFISGVSEGLQQNGIDGPRTVVPFVIILMILAVGEYLIRPHMQTFVASWFLANATGEDKPKISVVFRNGNFGRILLTKILVSLKRLLIALPAIILAGSATIIGLREGQLIMDETSNTLIANPNAGAPSTLFIVLGIAGIIAYIACIVITIRYSYSVAMVPYLLSEHPYDSAGNVIARSKTLMNGHRFEFFKFEFSYILWFIFGILTLGLGLIFYVNPYYSQGCACYYKELK